MLLICALVSSGVFSQLGLFPGSTEAAASRDLAHLPQAMYTLLVLWELPHFLFEIFFSTKLSNQTKTRKFGGVLMFVCVCCCSDWLLFVSKN